MTNLNPDKKRQLVEFISHHRLATLASLGPDGAPQAALMNIAVTQDLEVVFETTSQTRKFINLERDSRVALVIGWSGQETLQYEGRAIRPDGRRRDMARDAFVAAFPAKTADEHWPSNAYFLVTPHWLRFSSYYRPRFVEEYRLVDPIVAKPGCWARLRHSARTARQSD